MSRCRGRRYRVKIHHWHRHPHHWHRHPRVLHQLAREVRQLRRNLNEEFEELQDDIRDLRGEIRRDFRRILFSDRFAEFIRNAVTPEDNIAEQLRELLNRPAQVTTTAGPVSGTVIEVGADYVILQETPTTIVIIPFSSIISVQPLLTA